MKKKIIKLLVLLAVILVGLLPLGVNPYEQMRSSPVGRESNPSYNSCQHNSRNSNIHVALTVMAVRLTLDEAVYTLGML